MMQTIVKKGTFTEEEIRYCIRITKKRWGLRLPEGLKILLERDEQGVVTMLYDPPISRQTYRCTDYLVENLSRLNNAKRCEQRDKHMHLYIMPEDADM